jgi:hypothetical protein
MRLGYTFRSGRPTVTAITKGARPFVFGAAAHRERTHNPVIRKRFDDPLRTWG